MPPRGRLSLPNPVLSSVPHPPAPPRPGMIHSRPSLFPPPVRARRILPPRAAAWTVCGWCRRHVIARAKGVESNISQSNAVQVMSAVSCTGPHFLRARLAGLLPPPASAAALPPLPAPPPPPAPPSLAASYAAFMRAMFSLEAVAWSTMGLRHGAGGEGRGVGTECKGGAIAGSSSFMTFPTSQLHAGSPSCVHPAPLLCTTLSPDIPCLTDRG